jgi:HEAT repeat protein
MNIPELLNDKSLKPKQKTEALSKWILDNPENTNELIEFARASKDTAKATCIESFEFATKSNPEIASCACFEFVTKTLIDKSPRVRWESAKVIGNTAHLFPEKLEAAILNLIINTEHPGTVVRWSAAYALGEIIKIKTKHNKELIPSIETICKREEKNSIRKIYIDALKKIMI